MAISTSQDGDEVLSEINITPLVDVMLVLLVAFIVTAPLLSNAIKVQLPSTASTSAPESKKNFTLSIDANEVVYLDKVRVESQDLEGRLASLKSQFPDAAVHLHADTAVPYGAVAKVMAHVERVGISKLSVVTTPNSRS